MSEHPHIWRDDMAASITLRGLAPKHIRPMCFIDTEATGFAKHHQILDLAAIKVFTAGRVEYHETKVYLDDYGRKMADPRALEIVGWNAEEWKDAPRLHEALPPFVEFIAGSHLIGHSLETDVLRFIGPACDGIGVPFYLGLCFPMDCTEMLARKMLPGLESYTLAAMCRHFQIPEEGNHRAMGGAERARQVWQALCTREKS